MKNIGRVFGLSLASAGILACSDYGNNSPYGSGTVTASIDGAAWTSSAAVQATYSNGVLAFGGLNGSGTQILVTVPSVAATGTYTIGIGQAGVATLTQGVATWTTALSGGTGSVVVTTLSSGHAAGTFSFTSIAQTGGASGTKAVSNGTFDVTY